MAGYRPNVALLLVDREGCLLICERAGVRGGWQFPQGGVDDGESPREALHREVEEEIGLPPEAYEILESREGYAYRYSEEVKRRKRTSYRGQTQTYFLCRLREGAPPIDVHQRPREFQDYRWISPGEFDLNWVPAFKRGVYRQVIRDFFGVETGE